MKKMIFASCIVLLLTACASLKKTGYGSPRLEQELVNDKVFHVKEYATDKKYGYTAKKPIMVGGVHEGPQNERRFLNALAGPDGEVILYERLGSCCEFYTKNFPFGLLDVYEITYAGLEKPILLYLNMYDSDVLKVPVGFTLRTNFPDEDKLDPNLPFDLPLLNGKPIEEALPQYVVENINWTDEIESLKGLVVVQFTVETDGSVSNATVISSAHPTLDAESLRIIISSSLKWTPAQQNGKSVKMSLLNPIRFDGKMMQFR